MPAVSLDSTPREVAELAGAPTRMVEKAIAEKALTVRSGITVHSVEARLKAGDTLDEIAAENPDLPREAFAAAALFAKAHPLAGRPTNLPRRAA